MTIETQTPVLGVILAGGASRRMGGTDKFLMLLKNKPILEHIIDRLRPQVSDLIINSNNPDVLNQYDLEVVPDIKAGLGPLGGLSAALSYAKRKGYEKIVTVPCDTPFIPNDFLEKLLNNDNQKAVVAKSSGRLHPVIGLWHVSILGDVKASLENNNHKMMTLIKELGADEQTWDTPLDPFININTPEDLKEAEKRLC